MEIATLSASIIILKHLLNKFLAYYIHGVKASLNTLVHRFLTHASPDDIGQQSGEYGYDDGINHCLACSVRCLRYCRVRYLIRTCGHCTLFLAQDRLWCQ